MRKIEQLQDSLTKRIPNPLSSLDTLVEKFDSVPICTTMEKCASLSWAPQPHGMILSAGTQTNRLLPRSCYRYKLRFLMWLNLILLKVEVMGAWRVPELGSRDLLVTITLCA